MVSLDRLAAEIPALLWLVAKQELLPRLETAASNARLKAVGEVVTDADLAAEELLTEGLRYATPDVPIVGEEQAHAYPALLRDLDRHPWLWLVDPLDGTRHFAEGTGPFGTMLALLRQGVCEAAWIYLPLEEELCSARRGEGTMLNGQPIRIPPTPDALRGGLLTRFFPEPLKAHAETFRDAERTEGLHHCAARRYVDLIKGREHFAAYWRTLPWDHAPGALLVEEAGGVVRRFNSEPYEPADVERTGLLVASDASTWERLRSEIIG